MGKVTFGLSVSLDGFIADKNDDVSEVFAWMGRAMEHFYEVIGDQLNEGIESAIAKARELAGEKNIALHGASAVQQALKAGLLDEINMSVAHVLLGEGVRLFDHLGSKPIHLEHIRTLETPGATHLSFRVVK